MVASVGSASSAAANAATAAAKSRLPSASIPWSFSRAASDAAHGTAQFTIPDVLEVPPINQHGNVLEIAEHFGGEKKLVDAIHRLQSLLYAA